MLQKNVRNFLLLLSLFLLLATAIPALAGSDLTHEDVAAAEREYTYTTAEAVAAGKQAAENYWLNAHVIHEVAAAEREFTYTTAEAVERGKVAAEAYWQARQAASR